MGLFRSKPLPEHRVLSNKVISAIEPVLFAFNMRKLDISKLRAIFDSLDLGRVGLISAETIESFIKSHPLPYVKRVLLVFNDGTGYMYFPEFLLMTWMFNTLGEDSFCKIDFLYQ